MVHTKYYILQPWVSPIVFSLDFIQRKTLHLNHTEEKSQQALMSDKADAAAANWR
jgi:hypothetical protein